MKPYRDKLIITTILSLLFGRVNVSWADDEIFSKLRNIENEIFQIQQQQNEILSELKDEEIRTLSKANDETLDQMVNPLSKFPKYKCAPKLHDTISQIMICQPCSSSDTECH